MRLVLTFSAMSSALKIKILTFICLCLIGASCRSSSADVNSNNGDGVTVERPAAENAGLPPFATKEPDKYQASIFFASRFEEGAANFVEQTYRVARDGANRRLDFETGATHYAKLQTADGKVYILLPKKKVYAELTTAGDAPNLPEEISLEHLLHTKPIGASYERIGEEDLAGRKTVKYRLNFGAVKGAENARTETFVWADESLGLPVKTEIVAIENNQPVGAKNVIELREIKTEVAPEVFTVPKDFRKVSFEEIRKIMK